MCEREGRLESITAILVLLLSITCIVIFSNNIQPKIIPDYIL